MNILQLLDDMTSISAPSGYEDEIREYIKRISTAYCDDIQTDAMGNLIVHKRGEGRKLMFAAHMDEIGVIVTGIDDKGFINFAPLGGLNLRYIVNQRVRFMNGIHGVIGAKEDEFNDKPSYDKLHIDIGGKSREDVINAVSVGDCAVFTAGFSSINDTVISKTLDNRAGCAVLLKALSEVKKNVNDLYFVFTVQEEVGLRGAKTAAFNIEPDAAIAVDVIDTGDFPGAPKMDIKLGMGAAIKVMDRSVICDRSIRLKMIETAKKIDIPYQLEIMTDGGTDAGAIHLTRSGIKTGGISIPTRYIHSPSEMASIADMEGAARLVCAMAEDQL